MRDLRHADNSTAEVEAEIRDFLAQLSARTRLGVVPDREEPHASLSVRLDVDSAPSQIQPVVHAVLEIQATDGELSRFTSGPVCHQILALDLSASMNRPEKFPVVMKALRKMLVDLREPEQRDVVLSVVGFAWGATTLLRQVPAHSLHPDEFEEVIRESDLLFGRYTDVNGALRRAARLAAASHRENRRLPQRIMILTDGRPQDLEAALKTMRRIEKLPVDVDCLAFGDDADVVAMKQLVCGRRGGTVKLVHPDTVSEAFGRTAEVAQRVVAKRALLTVELQPGVVGGAAFRFRPARHAYGRAAFFRGRTFSTDIGTLETQRTYSMVFQLRLPETAATETEIGHVRLQIPGEGGARTFEQTVSIPRHPGRESRSPSPEVLRMLEILRGTSDADIERQLRALMARRALYHAERRDPRLVEAIEKAILVIQTEGSLDSLTSTERAALAAHSRTVLQAPVPVAH